MKQLDDQEAKAADDANATTLASTTTNPFLIPVERTPPGLLNAILSLSLFVK
jgi:hypothetical protein